MNINIERERWVIIRDENEIFCGLARNFHFNKLDDVKNTAIKTYLSEQKARQSFLFSWYRAYKLIESGSVKFVKIIECIKEK